MLVLYTVVAMLQVQFKRVRQYFKRVRQYLTLFVLRIQIWNQTRQLKRAAIELVELEATRVLTKWKWGASQHPASELRDSMLDLCSRIEQARKEIRDQNNKN